MSYKNPEDEKLRKKQHYEEHKQEYCARARGREAELKLVLNELKSSPCTDCGNSYPPYVMHFDHLNPSFKVRNVARMISHGSRAKMLEEIAKCELVCANCHAERTHGPLKRNGKPVLLTD